MLHRTLLFAEWLQDSYELRYLRQYYYIVELVIPHDIYLDFLRDYPDDRDEFETSYMRGLRFILNKSGFLRGEHHILYRVLEAEHHEYYEQWYIKFSIRTLASPPYQFQAVIL